MKKIFLNNGILFLLISSIILFFFIQQDIAVKRKNFLQQSYMDYTLPSKVTGLVAMEFKGIVSDFLFLKVVTFFGDKFIKNEKLKGRYADYLYNSMDIITDLDPWFWDAYLVADMMLTWDFNQIDQANKLLLKAKKYRINDFKVPYYIGFNYFYFLKDNANGAKYMMEAARLPDAPGYLASIAARLSMYQNQYGPAIVFLNDMLKINHSSQFQKQFKVRLKTLLIMDSLEKKVHEFKKKFGTFPDHLSDLADKGLIESIPDDPYGGKFIILENKRVYTTSKMIYK